MIGPEVRCLMRKEWRQALRSRGAMLTSLLMPLLFLVVIPCGQMLAFFATPPQAIPPGAVLPPGLAGLRDDPREVIRLLVPLMVTLGGLLVPSLAASYTVVSEREARTLDLLVAMPVRMAQVLAAKLLVIFCLAASACFGLFAIDATLLVALRFATPAFVAALGVVLLSALAYSTSSALLIGLLAKDFRTANNLGGLLFMPTFILTGVALVLLPGGALKLLILAAALLLAAGVAAWVAMRWVTFERLMR